MGQAVLDDILENVRIASDECVPICQDCGMAVIFMEVGQDVRFTEGDLAGAINDGVRQAYDEGYLRKSVVSDPLFERKNTGDNTPAIVHTAIVPGDRVRLVVTPKGMGSENMSAIRMMKAADGPEGVMDFVVETVDKAGPNPCPPIVVGVGIGGNFETAPLLAKRALLRPMGSRNGDPRYAGMEEELLRRINALGIGPAGYGGRTTALDVHVEFAPTHIAGMPVAVNICCHADRHGEAIL
jgi:fumarate hydratase subunit alpha